MKRKLIVLSGVLMLSLLASSAQAVVKSCTLYFGKSCPTNGAVEFCNGGVINYECECVNNRWFCSE
jgi:hypothetical protein